MTKAKQEENLQPVFNTQFVFLKESQLISPQSPRVFKHAVPMGIHFELSVTFNLIELDIHEVCLKLTVKAFPKKQEDEAMDRDAEPIYTAVVQYAGIFQIAGMDDTQEKQVKKIACPEILFPFARSHIVHLVTHAGFSPPYLAPINFAAVSAQAEAGVNNLQR